MMVEIRIRGHLSERWRDWLDQVEITNEQHGEAVLTGQLPDQAALIGLLSQLHGLNLTILSVREIPSGSPGV